MRKPPLLRWLVQGPTMTRMTPARQNENNNRSLVTVYKIKQVYCNCR